MNDTLTEITYNNYIITLTLDSLIRPERVPADLQWILISPSNVRGRLLLSLCKWAVTQSMECGEHRDDDGALRLGNELRYIILHK